MEAINYITGINCHCGIADKVFALNGDSCGFNSLPNHNKDLVYPFALWDLCELWLKIEKTPTDAGEGVIRMLLWTLPNCSKNYLKKHHCWSSFFNNMKTFKRFMMTLRYIEYNKQATGSTKERLWHKASTIRQEKALPYRFFKHEIFLKWYRNN